MEKKQKKNFSLQISILFFSLWCIISSGCYVSRLAYEQTKMLISKRSIDEVIKDPSTSKEVMNKLLFLQDVLNFSREEGLNVEGAYQKFILINRPVVSYTVYAAEADKLESVRWWFPIIGKVPYLGFFSKEDRDKEAEKLSAQGYDTYSSGVLAFSSLGWFEDPIYSSMLLLDDYSFAELIFHELTHRTIWFDNHADFNENLASFVAEVTNVRFFRFRKDEVAIAKYFEEKNDEVYFSKWLEQLKNNLSELYQDKTLDRQEIFTRKAMIFKNFTEENKPYFKKANFLGHKKWNNASVLASSLYSADFTDFYSALECSKEKKMGEFLKRLENMAKNLKEPSLALKSLCTPTVVR